MSEFDLEELVDVLDGVSPQPKPKARSPEKIESPKVDSNALLTKFNKIGTGDPLTPIQERFVEDSALSEIVLKSVTPAQPTQKITNDVERELLDLDGLASDESDSNRIGSIADSDLEKLVTIEDNSEESNKSSNVFNEFIE